MPTITPNKVFKIGPVGRSLDGKTPQEKAILKAQALKDISVLDFTKDGYSIHFLSAPFLSGNAIGVNIEATLNGRPLILDNPIYFINPPIMVPDGTFYRGTDPSGGEILKHNYEENLIEALKTIIVDAVHATGF